MGQGEVRGCSRAQVGTTARRPEFAPADLAALLPRRSDVEVVDVLLRIKETLGAAVGDDDDTDILLKARRKAACVQALLPEDLRISLGL